MEEGDTIHRFIFALLVFFCTLQLFDYVYELQADYTPVSLCQDLTDSEEKEEFSASHPSFGILFRSNTRPALTSKAETSRRRTANHPQFTAPLYAQHTTRVALHHVFCVYRI